MANYTTIERPTEKSATVQRQAEEKGQKTQPSERSLRQLGQATKHKFAD